jgi:hypothetical protein
MGNEGKGRFRMPLWHWKFLSDPWGEAVTPHCLGGRAGLKLWWLWSRFSFWSWGSTWRNPESKGGQTGKRVPSGELWLHLLFSFTIFPAFRENRTIGPHLQQSILHFFSWLPGLLSLTYSISSQQAQSSSDLNFGQKTSGLRMGPSPNERAIFNHLLLPFAFGPRVLRPVSQHLS